MAGRKDGSGMSLWMSLRIPGPHRRYKAEDISYIDLNHVYLEFPFDFSFYGQLKVFWNFVLNDFFLSTYIGKFFGIMFFLLHIWKFFFGNFNCMRYRKLGYMESTHAGGVL